MSFDSECDIAMETEGQPSLQPVIAGLRTKLLGEHLSKSVEEIESELGRCSGSIVQMIERVRRKKGATLQTLHPRELAPSERALAKSRLMDPEEPVKPSNRLLGFVRRAAKRSPKPLAIGASVAALGTILALRRARRD
jgi:hypothetical protein